MRVNGHRPSHLCRLRNLSMDLEFSNVIILKLKEKKNGGSCRLS